MSQFGDRRRSSHGTGGANLRGGNLPGARAQFSPRLIHDALAIHSPHVQAPVDHSAEVPRPGERPYVPARGGPRLSVHAVPTGAGMPLKPTDSGGQVQVQADRFDFKRPGQPGTP